MPQLSTAVQLLILVNIQQFNGRRLKLLVIYSHPVDNVVISIINIPAQTATVGDDRLKHLDRCSHKSDTQGFCLQPLPLRYSIYSSRFSSGSSSRCKR